MFERTTFRKVAELISDAVVMTDPEGRITWTNPAFHDLCGHSRQTVMNKKPGSFLQGPDTDSKTVERIRRAIRSKKPVEAEILNYHQNGRPYWVSLRITPVWDPQGKLEGFVAIEREVTAARCRQHSLEREVAKMYFTLVRELEKASA